MPDQPTVPNDKILQLAHELLHDEKDIQKRTEAFNTLAGEVATIPELIARDQYIGAVADQYKISKAVFSKLVHDISKARAERVQADQEREEKERHDREKNGYSSAEEYFQKFTINAIDWRAGRLLDGVTNVTAKGEALKKLAKTISLVQDDFLRGEHCKRIAENYKVKLNSLEKMVAEAIKKKAKEKKTRKINNDEWTYIVTNYKSEKEYITDKLTEEQKKSVKQYGFIEWKNAYYFGDLEFDKMLVNMHQKSNFALRILYHIKRNKNKNKRVVAIYNERGHKEVIDIETKQLTSLQAFKEFTEGAGYFLFKGNNDDLTKLKTKLMEEEKPCVQLDTLGWQKKGFFAFSNGIIRDNKFVPVDEFGIVEFNDMNFFIPYHPGTEETSNLNEKRFSWKPSGTTWHEWSSLYYQVFGTTGMVTMLFGCATLFSDHIFLVKGNFPILFLYGEGGSGKSKMIQFIQHWYGDPQPSLKVSEKANTDKGKIRKMAQFSNSIALFEEFVNTADIALVKTFTGFYDRYGYERADMDSRYGTETVPVLSSVAFTGNEYPQDDPFLQRLILIDHNVNEFTEEQQKLYDQLNKMNRQGLTQLVQYLLRSRKLFESQWEGEYEKYLSGFKKLCADLKVPSRMIENNAVLLATYATLKECGVVFPFSIDELGDFLLATLQAQSEKRDVGGAVQRFWDIVLHLFNQRKLEPGRHIDLNGNELMIRISEVHVFYLDEHFRMFRQQGLNKSTLMQKLKDSVAFMETAKSHRFSDRNTSCFVFDVEKLNIDFAYWWNERTVTPSPPPGFGQMPPYTQGEFQLKSFTDPKN